MSQTIRIDDEVFRELQKRALPFKTWQKDRPDTVNKVLRKVFHLPPFQQRRRKAGRK